MSNSAISLSILICSLFSGYSTVVSPSKIDFHFLADIPLPEDDILDDLLLLDQQALAAATEAAGNPHIPLLLGDHPIKTDHLFKPDGTSKPKEAWITVDISNYTTTRAAPPVLTSKITHSTSANLHTIMPDSGFLDTMSQSSD